MMPRDESQFTTKQEINTGDGAKLPKGSTGSTTTSWSRLKDPRIVRVSRAFGGKDRHSKVCTVRGLRDRRVRLSVPTAIQLYDLQDRLGLNQPSKVVDWLLNAAKHEIDELPPLQIPQGSLMSQSLQPYLDAQSAKQGLKISDTINWNDPLKLQARSNDTWGKSKDLFSGETSDHREENWARSQQEFQENQGAYNYSSNNFLSRQNHSNSIPNLLSSSNIPYNSFVRWDPSNLTLSHHPPRSHGLMVQHDQDSPNFSLVPLQQTISSGSHPVLVYQPGISTQSYFPSQIALPDSDFTQKQMHFTSSNSPITSHADSTSQSVRPFHFSMTADLLPRNDDKDNDFHN